MCCVPNKNIVPNHDLLTAAVYGFGMKTVFQAVLCIALSMILTGCWAFNCSSVNLRLPDALEPNDTPSTATVLETTREATFNSEENDTYQFTATAGEQLTITVETLEAGVQSARYALCLTDTKGLKGIRCDDRAYPEEPNLTFTATQSGTYVLDVVEPKFGCRHICGCPVRGSSYRITLERVAAPR
jgi:Bacterial pre-peptidase C-terminal domain